MADSYPSTYKEMYMVPPEIYNAIYTSASKELQTEIDIVNRSNTSIPAPTSQVSVSTRPIPDFTSDVYTTTPPGSSRSKEEIQLTPMITSTPSKNFTQPIPESSKDVSMDAPSSLINQSLDRTMSNNQTVSDQMTTEDFRGEKSKEEIIEEGQQLEQLSAEEPKKRKVFRDLFNEIKDLDRKLNLVRKICLNNLVKRLQRKKNLNQSFPIMQEEEELEAINTQIQAIKRNLQKESELQSRVGKKKRKAPDSPYKPSIQAKKIVDRSPYMFRVKKGDGFVMW